MLDPVSVESRPSPLVGFVAAFADLLDERPVESEILARGGRLLEDLIADDDWLPDSHAAADPDRYQQHLLYLDPRRRFSIVSFIWGAGQSTAVHDHRVWGLIGVLRGAELSVRFRRDVEGTLRANGPPRLLERGTVDAVSPRVGDIHRVANAYDDRTAISIHVYGADIGAVNRSVYDPNGRPTSFVSGYSAVPALLAGVRS